MSESNEQHLPQELHAIAARLQAERTHADPLELDQIKRRVMARCSPTARRSTSMKSKLATIGTLLAMIGGTGGAIALGSKSNGNGYTSGAATAQYVSGKHAKKHHKKHHKKKHVKAVRRHRTTAPSFTG